MRSNDKQWRHVVCAQMISSGQTRTHLLIITVRSRIVLFDAVCVQTVQYVAYNGSVLDGYILGR